MKNIFKKIALTCICAYALFCNAQSNPNLPGMAIPSAAYTGTSIVSGDRTNLTWRGATFVVNITSYTSGTYTPHIQGKDPVSGVYYDILVGASLNSTGTTVLTVYPGVTATANVSASAILPATWRVNMVGASTPSATFSVGMFLAN